MRQMKDLVIKLRHGIQKDFRLTLLFNLTSSYLSFLPSSAAVLRQINKTNQRKKGWKKHTRHDNCGKSFFAYETIRLLSA